MIPLPYLISKIAAQGNKRVQHPRIPQRPGSKHCEQDQPTDPRPGVCLPCAPNQHSQQGERERRVYQHCQAAIPSMAAQSPFPDLPRNAVPEPPCRSGVVPTSWCPKALPAAKAAAETAAQNIPAIFAVAAPNNWPATCMIAATVNTPNTVCNSIIPTAEAKL